MPYRYLARYIYMAYLLWIKIVNTEKNISLMQ